MGFFDEIGDVFKEGLGNLGSKEALGPLLQGMLYLAPTLFGADESGISDYQQAQLNLENSQLEQNRQLAMAELAYKYAALSKAGGGGGGGASKAIAEMVDKRERDAMKQQALQAEFSNLVNLIQATKPDISARAGENMVQAAQNTGQMGIQGFGQLASSLQAPAISAARR